MQDICFSLIKCFRSENQWYLFTNESDDQLFAEICPFSGRRQWHPTPVHLPGKSHAWRSLVGCSPWDCKESDTTEQLHFHFSLSWIGEGNGNPLRCSCLENPRNGGAWWAAVYGVAQSRTRLKWLSSSSSLYILSSLLFLGTNSPCCVVQPVHSRSRSYSVSPFTICLLSSNLHFPHIPFLLSPISPVPWQNSVADLSLSTVILLSFSHIHACQVFFPHHPWPRCFFGQGHWWLPFC